MPAAPAAPAATALLLIVSADHRLQRTLCLDLDAPPYRIGIATTEQEALDTIRHEQPQVVLLDVNHPSVDAEVIARALQTRGTMVPMILLGRDPKALSERAVELGAVAYAVTPFVLGTLPAL
jgi:two-component system, OmpR family, response regulator RpaB